MTDAFIYDATRTPRGKGKKDSALHSVKPTNLMVGLLRAVQRRSGLGTAQAGDIVLGCMTPVDDQGADITKTAALVADRDERIAGVQINRFCISGLEAMNLGAMKVRSGFGGLVLVGGVKSMSRMPMSSDGGTQALDPETSLYINFVPQETGADLITTLEDFNRADIGVFALRSQREAAKTRAEELFGKSLVPVTDRNGIILLDHDEFIRADSTLEGLTILKPSFEMMGQMGSDAATLREYSQVECIEYVHTPGNNSEIVDGASAMLVGFEAKGRELGLKARARVVATAMTSTGPIIIFTGPAPTARKTLIKAGLRVEDIGLFEVNEAFTSVVTKFIKDMGMAESKVNTNGGAIAMGRPLGATGCIILGTLLDELERHNPHYGLATLCVGGGIDIAIIVERVRRENRND